MFARLRHFRKQGKKPKKSHERHVDFDPEAVGLGDRHLGTPAGQREAGAADARRAGALTKRAQPANALPLRTPQTTRMRCSRRSPCRTRSK